MSVNRDVLYALSAAALFGASTPFAKLLVAEISPWLLAGLRPTPVKARARGGGIIKICKA